MRDAGPVRQASFSQELKSEIVIRLFRHYQSYFKKAIAMQRHTSRKRMWFMLCICLFVAAQFIRLL